MAGFVHLHVHSEYSLLDGLNSCHELAERAVELGMPALALTDHGAMYGAVQFYKACKAAGIKPIIGMEAYVAPRSRREKDPQDRKPYHLILLAQNESGYRNLMRLATVAQLEGFYYKPRIDKDILAECADGLIVLSGCGTSEVPRLILEGQLDEARRVIAWYRDVFPGRYFLEIQDHDIPELARANRQMIALAREFDLPLVATNDVHYTHREEAGIHDVLLCIQTGKTVTEPNRLRMDGDTYYMRDAGEMAALFSDVPEALSNTLRVAEMCDLKLEFGHYHLPIFHVPAGYDAQSYLRYLCEEGLQQRYAVITPEIRQRLEHELDVIHRMGFDTYFLIVWDLCRFAREHDIWWNVRGSAAGSIVAYTLGITNLEPLQHGLIFERFLNLGRVTMPDIDLDFPDDQRDQLIRYTIEKYGQEQVAQIITFGTMGAKAAIRDVGRALDYPLAEVDRIARLVPFGPKVTLDQALAEVPELREAYENEEHIRRLVDTARGVEGNVRHASTHAAGVVVSDAPLVTYTPLNRPTSGEGEIGVVTQYTMEELEALGLLKIDFLGLATLTIMRRACELIRQRHGVRLHLHNIPTEDPAIFDLLSRGDVMGVFQVEGAGMRRVLMKMQPRQFDHIVATISLFRPGPMEYIDDYIDRMHGRKPIEYRHPRLEPILGETYGVCIAGDAIVTDVCTGRRLRLDECGSATNLVVQGVDADWRTVTARVTRWVANGQKPVYRVTLQNGASIKLTADHRVLTEDGWRPIRELSVGDYIATPPYLMPQNESFDRDKLRVLAYLIADGDLGNMASVNFVSKDPCLLAEYERCLRVFPNLKIPLITQVHEVVRVGVAKHALGNGFVYHTPNALLAWLRELGLKHPAGDKPGGCRSDEKFVPEFVFALSPDLIAWFLASLWDCDGYMGRKLCHYKTTSRRLAEDVQTLLLKLGIQSTIHTADYTSQTGHKSSYQVTVYDTARLAAMLQPLMVTDKRQVVCIGRSSTTIARAPFIAEVEAHTTLSKRALMFQYGIDRQHFYSRGRQRPRISGRVISGLAEALGLQETQRRLRLNWERIIAIEPAGVEPVYDLTVENIHNFTANNILVHNCVYQEQIIRILTDIAGYSASDADLVRRAVGKKKKEELLHHRESFIAGATQHSGLPTEIAGAIFDDIEYFARYGFNRAHAADYAVLTCQTAYLKARYPVEYMTALLSVERNNTEKVGLLIAECRRMGIEVLPPDVNCSDLDFTIEEQPDGRPAIRFGLAAIKNVGEGAVQAILTARRAGGPFRDLDDFCRRVDVRQVNRRALECLIKVGALQPFGTRAQLLSILDRIIGLSANLHRAREMGQMSLFEATSALLETGTLLPGSSPMPEAPQKEVLAWEKDLVGVYISEHPLVEALVRLQDVVTAYVGTLAEMNGQQVVVVGMVQRVRRHTTKKGDEMAFVTLEDLQGECDVVVFPRLWKQTRHLWQPERILVVGGKVDMGQRDEPSLLCDWAKTPEEVTVPAERDRPQAVMPARPGPPQPPQVQPAASPVRTVCVTLARTGEQTRDMQTLRRIHSLLAQRPGRDHFTIRLIGGTSKPVELAFPNDTTSYSPELAQELASIVGADAVQVVEGIR